MTCEQRHSGVSISAQSPKDWGNWDRVLVTETRGPTKSKIFIVYRKHGPTRPQQNTVSGLPHVPSPLSLFYFPSKRSFSLHVIYVLYRHIHVFYIGTVYIHMHVCVCTRTYVSCAHSVTSFISLFLIPKTSACSSQVLSKCWLAE